MLLMILSRFCLPSYLLLPFALSSFLFALNKYLLSLIKETVNEWLNSFSSTDKITSISIFF